ncbi:MAG: hypothetical protein PHN74_02295 [Candidatus Pacebacteria bacterium]|nr:hypothetical protein [Candidatus Paceibacterota bacterium]
MNLPIKDKFFEEIGKVDEGTRKKWLWVFSSLTMFAVVGLWFVYINYSIKGVGEEKKVVAKSNEPPFAEVMKSGLANIFGKLKSDIAKTRTMTIQGASINFVLEDLEEIKQGGLPDN